MARFAVASIVRLVAITPVPHTPPEIVLGVINVQGWIMPVVNLRRHFRLPARALGPNDQLLFVHAARRPVALVIDAATEIAALADQDAIAEEKILAHLECIAGLVKGVDGLMLLHNLDRLLSLTAPHPHWHPRSVSQGCDQPARGDIGRRPIAGGQPANRS